MSHEAKRKRKVYKIYYFSKVVKKMAEPNLAHFVEDCPSMQRFFEKAKAEGRYPIPVSIVGEKPGPLQILEAKHDFALVVKPGSGMLDGDIDQTLVHPYGSDVGYKFDEC